MKKFILTSLFISSFSAMAMTEAEKIEKINLLAPSESLNRKHESELAYKNQLLKKNNDKILELANNYEELFSKYRLVQSEAEYLRKQNDSLIEALKNSGSYTPELAGKNKASDGRMPASAPTEKTNK